MLIGVSERLNFQAPLRKRKLPVKSYALRARPLRENSFSRAPHCTFQFEVLPYSFHGSLEPTPRIEGSPTLFYLFCILAQAPPEIARRRAQCRFGGSQGHAGSAILSSASQSTQATIRLFPLSQFRCPRSQANALGPRANSSSARTRIASVSLLQRYLCRQSIRLAIDVLDQ